MIQCHPRIYDMGGLYYALNQVLQQYCSIHVENVLCWMLTNGTNMSPFILIDFMCPLLLG